MTSRSRLRLTGWSAGAKCKFCSTAIEEDGKFKIYEGSIFCWACYWAGHHNRLKDASNKLYLHPENENENGKKRESLKHQGIIVI